MNAPLIKNKERLVRGAPRQNTLIAFPVEIRAVMEEARIQESQLTRQQVTLTDFIVKSVIDRIGVVLGEGRANYLYRRYFNGIGFISPKDDPTISNPQPIGSVKPEPRRLSAPQTFQLNCEEEDE